jgi:phosphoribosyl 1,2-cyclic phosphodiesterase
VRVDSLEKRLEVLERTEEPIEIKIFWTHEEHDHTHGTIVVRLKWRDELILKK